MPLSIWDFFESIRTDIQTYANLLLTSLHAKPGSCLPCLSHSREENIYVHNPLCLPHYFFFLWLQSLPMLQAEFSRNRCWDRVSGARCLGQMETMKRKNRRKQNWAEKKGELWCSSHHLSQLCRCRGMNCAQQSCLALSWMAGPLCCHISHFPGARWELWA